MFNAYFAVVFFTLLHISTGLDYIGTSSNPVPDSFSNSPSFTNLQNSDLIDSSQCNPTSGTIFWNVPEVAIFTNKFREIASNSNILRNAFDLSQTKAVDYSNYIYNINLDLLKGFDNAVSVADAIAQEITSNFNVLTMPFMMRLKSNLAADVLYSDGILSENNAESLAMTYAKVIEDYADVALTSDPTSKFRVITDSFFEFMNSVNPNAIKMKPMLVLYYLSEWKLANVNYKNINQ